MLANISKIVSIDELEILQYLCLLQYVNIQVIAATLTNSDKVMSIGVGVSNITVDTLQITIITYP
jgi:hypothetical protein